MALWLASDNRITVWNVQKDEKTGRYTCSGSIREKNRQTEEVTYSSVNTRFSPKIADKVAQLKDRDIITITKGTVEFYQSKKYLSSNGKGIYLPYVMVFDFDFVKFDNNGNPTSQAKPTKAAANTSKANPLEEPMPEADDLPF